MAVHEQLFGPQDWVLSSALGIDDYYKSKLFATTLCSKEPIKQSRGEPQISHTPPLHMDFSLSLASELEKQGLEMDLFLHFQNERLRTILLEESRRQYILLQRYETKLNDMVMQRDEDLTSATSRTMELQNCLLRAEMEAQEWQKKAMENEAMVLDLSKKLSQMREQVNEDCYWMQSVNNGAQDAESVCDIEEEEAQNDQYNSSNNNRKKKLACKLCHVRSSCVLFLPCRHLCCCKSCEGLLGFCLVCGTPKNAGLEVLIC